MMQQRYHIAPDDVCMIVEPSYDGDHLFSAYLPDFSPSRLYFNNMDLFTQALLPILHSIHRRKTEKQETTKKNPQKNKKNPLTRVSSAGNEIKRVL